MQSSAGSGGKVVTVYDVKVEMQLGDNLIDVCRKERTAGKHECQQKKKLSHIAEAKPDQKAHDHWILSTTVPGQKANVGIVSTPSTCDSTATPTVREPCRKKTDRQRGKTLLMPQPCFSCQSGFDALPRRVHERHSRPPPPHLRADQVRRRGRHELPRTITRHGSHHHPRWR